MIPEFLPAGVLEGTHLDELNTASVNPGFYSPWFLPPDALTNKRKSSSPFRAYRNDGLVLLSLTSAHSPTAARKGVIVTMGNSTPIDTSVDN